jgi:hypothetical protein
MLWVVAAYITWLGMMAVHEAGHVLHAWATGGRVVRVELPLAGFSRTDVSPNPNPAAVAWGGPVWGCLLPLAAWMACPRKLHRVKTTSQSFAGFCLIANGVYLGVGWIDRVGDAGDLLRRGTPVWVLVVVGLFASSGGLYLWHQVGAARVPDRSPSRHPEGA